MAMQFRFRKGSVASTLGNLRGVRRVVAQTLALSAAGDVLFNETKVNISLTDHTLRDLARLDHPYAKRHGSIQIHQEKPFVVHSQSGQLRRALKRRLRRTGTRLSYDVFFDESEAPYAKWVVGGTKKMLQRNVIEDTSDDPAVRRQMMRAIVRVLGKELRTKAAIRFI